MAKIILGALIAAYFLAAHPSRIAGQNSSALLASADRLYQTGEFDQAANEYRQIIVQYPDNIPAERGLVRALLKAERPDEAAEAAVKAVTLAPHDAPLITLLGDVYFRQARFDASKMLYLTALTVNPKSASAYAGLGRLMLTESNDMQAMRDFSRACAAAPIDINILLSCAGATKDPAKRMAFLQQYLAAAPRNDPDDYERASVNFKVGQFLSGRKTFVCTGPARGSIKLDAVWFGPNIMRGLRVPVLLNGHKRVWLVLDTGAGSGLLLNRKVADKLGVKPLSSSEVKGLGGSSEEGERIGWIESMRVGDFEFHNCLVEYTDKNFEGDTDGLLGVGIFSRYLVSINYPKERLDLSPLPPITPMKLASPQSADVPNGIIPAGLEQFTRVRKLNSHLLIPATVNGLNGPFFLIDTGAQMNLISERLARRIGELKQSNQSIKGVTGRLTDVYEAKEKVTLRFADFEQTDANLAAVDLNVMSKGLGVEISGVIGQPILRYLTLVIDYRDGLVNFIYDKKTAPF